MEKGGRNLQHDARLGELLRRPPKLHVHDGRPISWGINRGLISLLRREVVPGSRTVETGSGISTIVFLLLGAVHDAISPDPAEEQRIRAYCEQHAISMAGYTHHVARSEDYLPRLPAEPTVDVALIDGNHAFPAPAIDWFYATRGLKRGGLIILDDVSLWSVRIVANVLSADDGWERVERARQFAAYRLKIDASDALGRWWGEQRHVVKHSSVRGARGLPKRSPLAWLREC